MWWYLVKFPRILYKKSTISQKLKIAKMLFHRFQHIAKKSLAIFFCQFPKYFEYKIDHISKSQNYFYRRFQNIAHLSWPKTQFDHFWEGREGGICISLTRNNPYLLCWGWTLPSLLSGYTSYLLHICLATHRTCSAEG